MVEGKDYIKDLFSEKLSGIEADVRPDLWANISSQVGAASGTAGTAGLSVVAKTIITITVAASVIGTGVFFFTKEDKQVKPVEEIVEKVQENPTADNNSTKLSEKIVIESNKDHSNINSNEIKVWEDPIKIITAQSNENLDKSSGFTIVDQPETVDGNPELKENKQNPEIIVHRNEDQIQRQNDEVSENLENQENTGDIKESTIILPNIFSPNGDGHSDQLFLNPEELIGLTDFNVVVLNQNNQVVYQSDQSDFIWDGRGLDGNVVPAGNYIYYITARDVKGKLITKYNSLRIQI